MMAGLLARRLRALAGPALAACLAVGGSSPAPAGPILDVTQGPDSLRIPGKITEVEQAFEKVRRHEFDQALDLLKTAAAAHGDMFPARLMLGKICLVAGQTAAARRALEQFAAEDPKHPETYIVLGKVALGEGRLTEASLLFERAVMLLPASRLPADQKRGVQSDGQSGLAAAAEGRKDWAAAAAALTAWLESEPNNPRTRSRLGRALFWLGRRDQARSELERAARADPTLEPAAVSLAELYSQEGDSQKATQWFESAVAEAPKDARPSIAFASWLLEQGRAEESRQRIEAAARLNPDAIEVLSVRGLIAWQLKDFAEAERIFAKLHIESPGNLAVSGLWAQALAAQSEPSKQRRALQIAEINVRLAPSSSEALTALGWASYRLGQLDEAERALRAALAGGANSETAYFLAKVLADRGRAGEVRPLLKVSLDARGRFAFRKEAREWLDRLDIAEAGRGQAR